MFFYKHIPLRDYIQESFFQYFFLKFDPLSAFQQKFTTEQEQLYCTINIKNFNIKMNRQENEDDIRVQET